MNAPDFYVKLYGALYNRRGVHYRLLSPLRFVIRTLANWRIPSYLCQHPQDKQGRTIQGLIVSFTSFPARIEKVWLVVESMKRQSYLPEKIILWLSKEQFPTEESVPQSLVERIDRLFEIQRMEGDLKSYKKFFYSFLYYPNKTIITIDDDVYYHPDTIKHLVDSSHSYPHCIIANITSRLTFNKGVVNPYRLWCSRVKPFDSNDLVQKGVGGVLYPPHLLPSLAIREDLFMSLAPLADDLWLNAMARMNKVPVVQSSFKSLFLEINNGATSLSSVNVTQEQNDPQLASIRKYLTEKFQVDVYSENW